MAGAAAVRMALKGEDAVMAGFRPPRCVGALPLRMPCRYRW